MVFFNTLPCEGAQPPLAGYVQLLRLQGEAPIILIVACSPRVCDFCVAGAVPTACEGCYGEREGGCWRVPARTAAHRNVLRADMPRLLCLQRASVRCVPAVWRPRLGLVVVCPVWVCPYNSTVLADAEYLFLFVLVSVELITQNQCVHYHNWDRLYGKDCLRPV